MGATHTRNIPGPLCAVEPVKLNKQRPIVMKRQLSQMQDGGTSYAVALLATAAALTSGLYAEPQSAQAAQLDANLRAKIGHIIVIYQENWSFDSLYGQFPGINGLANGFD